MKKIKIFRVIDRYLDSDYYNDPGYDSVLAAGVSDWEEVSDEDLHFIRDNFGRLRALFPRDSIVIVEQMDSGAEKIMGGIKKAIEEQRKKEEADRAEYKRKQEEAAARKAMRKLEKDRKALERLVKENPDLIKEISNG